MLKKQNIIKAIFPIVVALIASISVGAFFSYFTHARKLANTFTVGNNAIAIAEDFDPPNELTAGINIYTKKVQIENIGTTNAFVRVYAAFSDSDIADVSFIAASKPKDISIDADATFDAVTNVMENAGYKTSADFWKESGPSNDWIYIPKDENVNLGGYFYYTKPVVSGKVTTELMNTVATWFQDENDIKDYELIIYAESIQTADKSGAYFDDADYLDAWTEYLERK